jgi:hypothetical protein
MTSINPTSAYIRSKTAPGDICGLERRADSSAFLDEIWSLLSTPQTVDTLRRRIAHDSGVLPDDSAVVSALKDLLARDWIEMSPDV